MLYYPVRVPGGSPLRHLSQRTDCGDTESLGQLVCGLEKALDEAVGSHPDLLQGIGLPGAVSVSEELLSRSGLADGAPDPVELGAEFLLGHDQLEVRLRLLNGNQPAATAVIEDEGQAELTLDVSLQLPEDAIAHLELDQHVMEISHLRGL